MPTGYTCIIEDNDATFGQYVWRCARAFGALILMRDDSLSATPPERFEPDSYYTQCLETATAELKALLEMRTDAIERACAEDYERSLADWKESTARERTKQERYAKMRKHVEAWAPPTADHTRLKDFMIEQIDLCAKDPWFPAAPKRKRPGDWHAERIEWARRSVEQAAKSATEEQERCRNRNEWLKALRESVPYEAQP